MSKKKKTEKVARAKEEEGRHTSNKERISMVKWMLMNPTFEKTWTHKGKSKKVFNTIAVGSIFRKIRALES